MVQPWMLRVGIGMNKGNRPERGIFCSVNTQGNFWILLHLHLCLLIFSLSRLNVLCPLLQMLIRFNCILSSTNLCLAPFLMYALLLPPLLLNMFLL